MERVDPLSGDGWDAWVMSHPDACFFHTSAWARVLREACGYRPSYFAVCEAGRLRALLPVMEAASFLTGRRGVSLPYTDFCQPLVSEGVAFDKLLSEVLAYGKRQGWKYLECRGGRNLLPEVRPSLSFYGHTLDLSGGAERLLAGCESGVRRAIRKAERAGVRVEFSLTVESLRCFYALYCNTRKKHGLPPQPFKFFQRIWEHVIARDQGFVALGWLGQRPIAGAVFFHVGMKALFKYGASEEAFLPLRGNNLVMWEAIKRCAGSGYHELHFGRTSLGNKGLRAYKRGWGVQEHLLEYFRYDLRKDAYVAPEDRSYGWHNRVFHLMPVPLCRLAGAVLCRHWS